MKTAFLFPGQGSQYVGMGKELAAEHDIVKRTFEEADDILQNKISSLCFAGPDEQLNRTEITQPAILACSVAILRLVESNGLQPDVIAGHSLGEYTGLVAAGGISFADALRLVSKRGNYMQSAVHEGFGAMAAIIGMESGKLENLCAEFSQDDAIVVCANYNSQNQIVISGSRAAVEKVVSAAKAVGIRKAIMLPVSVPSHSPFMNGAAAKLRLAFNSVAIKDLEVPLVTNVDAVSVCNADDIKDALFRQLFSPVNWVGSIDHMFKAGIERFIEIGPKKILSRLFRDMPNRDGESADIQVLNIEDCKSFARLCSG